MIAHGAISNNVEPLWIAKEQGIFRKYGIDADLVFIIAGRAMQAMLAGQVPVGLVGGTHVVNANTGGGDFSMILGLENQLDYLFLAKSTIKSGEDLKGKKVGIGTPAGSASLAAYVSMDYLGLVPRRDNIVLLGVGGVPERMSALRSGSVDATIYLQRLASRCWAKAIVCWSIWEKKTCSSNPRGWSFRAAG